MLVYMVQYEQLKRYIYRLQTNKKALVRVTDESGSVVANNLSAEEINENYGSIVKFFEFLQENNSKLHIEPKMLRAERADGSLWIITDHEFPPFTVEFNKPTETQPSMQQPLTPPMVHHGMAGVGLNGAELYKVYDYERLKTEYTRLQDLNESYKNKIEELKEEITENRINKGSSNLVESLAGLAKEFAPVITQVMSKNPAAAGLSQPDPNLTTTQINFIEAVKQTDDYLLLFLNEVGMLVNSNAQAFEEVQNVINKYK